MTLLKKICFLFVFLLTTKIFGISDSTNILGDGTISGMVIDASTNEPIAFATIIVYDHTNKSIGGAISNDKGAFEIAKIPDGNYTVEIQFIGYENLTRAVVVKPGQRAIDLGTVGLTNVGQNLDEVLIKADKPVYVQKVDRTVINVQSSILSAGSTAMDILERSPGITVNRQNSSISLLGKDGVMVMLNGKISYMPQASIVQLLEGMSSDNIETIELITTPPANMDAAGNAGFINIVMKKQADVGVNGSYSLSGGYGNGTTTQDNINFNYRKNKLNLFGNYSFLRRNQDQIFQLGRTVTDEDENVMDLHTISYRDPVQLNNNIRFGLDYNLSEKTIVGAIIDAYNQKWTMDAESESTETENGAPVSNIEIDVKEKNQTKHFGSNINLKHNFEEKESISIDLDYLYFFNDNPNDYNDTYYDGDGNFIKEELTKSSKETPLNAFVTSADYSNQVNDKLKFQAGAKASFSAMANDVSVSNYNGQEYIEDPTLTNESDLDERIYALYSSADYTISEKTSLKLGLRYEYTDTELVSDQDGLLVDRNYGEFFPTAYISHNVNDTLSFNLAYSRRITRPSFNDMAPFVIFFDPNTFFGGNPAIQPAISNALSFGTNYKSYIFSAQYTIEDGTIARFQQKYDEENDRLIYESGNIDETKTFSLSLGLPVKLTNWWKTQNTFIYINTKIEDVSDEQVKTNLEQNTFNIASTQSFNISETLSSEININFNGPTIYGTLEAESNFYMNFGIQKKLGDRWGTLRFNINDLFDSQKFVAEAGLPEQNLKTFSDIDWSNRTYVLTYTRNFGNQKLKSSRERETGAQEERNRAN